MRSAVRRSSRFSVVVTALASLVACNQPDRAAPAAAPSASPPAPSGAPVAPGAAAISAAPPLPWDKPVPEISPTLQALGGSILVGGRSYALLRELSDSFGPRLTGSKVHAGAAAWAADTLRKMGVDDVHLEEFDLEAGWERGPVTLRTTAPVTRELSAEATGWAVPPPNGSVTADVVLLAEMSDEAIRARSKELAGKLVLLGKRAGTRSFAARQKAVAALKDVGVAGVLFRGKRYNNARNAHGCWGCASLVSPVPMVDVGMEDAAWLERRLEEGKVTVTLANQSRVTGPVKVPNVVAEIRGRETPNEHVLLGAHLDAWDFASGAQDNGAGAAQVLEAARAILAAGPRPRRSIRFALWAGEEEGLFGSRAYVKSHAKELDRLVAVVNTDHGAGAPKAWWTDAREDMLKRFEPLAAKLFAGIGPTELKDEFHCDTDHCPFVLEGIPTFDLEVEDAVYGEIHHAESDTLDKVKPHELALGAASVALAAYALADMPERVGPRLPHARVTENLKAKGGLDDLVAEGLYKP